jgi:hypothetical protein
MLVPPLVQQNAQRDRFLRAISLSRRVYGVVGEQGLARLPSRRLRGRDVSLFWSDEATAARWAPVVASQPRVKSFALGEMLASVLPGLSQHRRLVGLDWEGGDSLIELDPKDFGERMRLACLDTFVRSARRSGAIFTLEGPYGPALLVSQTRPDVLVLPCWADPGEAYERLEGPWRDMLVIENPVCEFLSERLGWLARFGHLAGPEYRAGPGALEMQPEDLRACFLAAAA